MQKITPFLWFDNNAEEAMNFYIAIFKNSRVLKIARFTEGAPGPKGAVMMASFSLDGQEFIALNGGPTFAFSPAISFVVNCETQDEVDRFWERLSEGGEQIQCGWLKDKFGVSWQIVPIILGEMLSGSDEIRAQRVMSAMLQMKKIEIAALRKAYDNEP